MHIIEYIICIWGNSFRKSASLSDICLWG